MVPAPCGLVFEQVGTVTFGRPATSLVFQSDACCLRPEF